MPRKDEQLLEELNEFQKEKERIRNIVGQIGGTHKFRTYDYQLYFYCIDSSITHIGNSIAKNITIFDIGSSSFIRYL